MNQRMIKPTLLIRIKENHINPMVQDRHFPVKNRKRNDAESTILFQILYIFRTYSLSRFFIEK